MYHAYWGLKESPFRGGAGLEFFFQSPTHEEALARLQFLVEDQRRLGLLLGDSGSGKSLLLDVFAREQAYQGNQVASANLLGASPDEVLWRLCADLGCNPSPGSSAARLWRQLVDKLTENRWLNLGTIVLLDDADEATPETLSQVTRLGQLEPHPGNRLTLVLAGQSRRTERLGKRLLEVAELRVDLQTWDEHDTAAYLEYVLAAAGRYEAVFKPEAIVELHVLSGGVPRRLKQLADLTLAAGAGQHLDVIDADTVVSVYQELAVACG